MTTDFRILTGDEVIETASERRRATEWWRRVVRGDRAHLPGKKPSQLTYWYRRAAKDGFAITLTYAKVDGQWGTIVQRSYDEVPAALLAEEPDGDD